MKSTAKLSLERFLANSGAAVSVLKAKAGSSIKLFRQTTAPAPRFELNGPAGLYALLLPVRSADS
jgi:hypothetical protein